MLTLLGGARVVPSGAAWVGHGSNALGQLVLESAWVHQEDSRLPSPSCMASTTSGIDAASSNLFISPSLWPRFARGWGEFEMTPGMGLTHDSGLPFFQATAPIDQQQCPQPNLACGVSVCTSARVGGTAATRVQCGQTPYDSPRALLLVFRFR